MEGNLVVGAEKKRKAKDIFVWPSRSFVALLIHEEDHMLTHLLDDNQIEEHLLQTPAWQMQGKAIVRTFERKDFVAAIGFVTSVGILAERADHHPDIDIRWNRVTLTLSTHSVGGLTGKDFALARSIDAL